MAYDGSDLSAILTEYFVNPFCGAPEGSNGAGGSGKFPSDGRFIFRGISRYKHEIVSGAAIRLNYNRPEGKEYRQIDFINYHVNLIEQRKLLLSDSLQSRRDLEHLAEIQHHGGATCLIDFTYNYLLALFFASGRKDVEIKNPSATASEQLQKHEVGPAASKDREIDEQDPDGAVFCIDLNNELNQKIRPVSENSLKAPIGDLLKKRYRSDGKSQPRIWLWKPVRLNTRIVKQDSVFLFSLAKAVPNGNVHYTKIRVKKEHKELIRHLLSTLFNISESTIYDDLAGFSNIFNNKGKEIDNSLLKGGSSCLSYARKLLDDGNYFSSLSYLDDAVDCISKRGRKLRTCPFACDESILGDIYFYRGVNLKKDRRLVNALNSYLYAYDHSENTSKNRKLDISYEIILVCYKLEKYKFGFDFVNKILALDENKDDTNLQFCLLELALFSKQYKKYLEIAAMLINEYRDCSKINLLLVLKTYLLVGATLIINNEVGEYDQLAEEIFDDEVDDVVDLFKNIERHDSNEEVVGRLMPKITKTYSPDTIRFLLEKITVQEGDSTSYCQQLSWEFDSISHYVTKVVSNEQVKLFIMRKIGKAQDYDKQLFTNFVLAEDQF